ncbi:MAG: 6-phosphogluconolactonase, partial [Mesorhizobium sp.]
MAREQLSEVSYGWNGFADRQDLATALAGEIADRLTRAITERGAALLA